MNNHMLILALLITSFFSCKDKDVKMSDLVGNYEVSMKLKEGTIDKASIKDSIDNAMEIAKKDIQKAKSEMEKDLNIDEIDTTTAEGKIEYLTKSFGKSIADVGLNIGDEMTEMASDLATKGLNLSEEILSKIRVNIELFENGKVKSSASLFNIGMDDATWKVAGNQFFITKDNESEKDSFTIIQRSQNGFILEKDKFHFVFTKK
ncbi:MAG: hypothetical protein IPO92_00295 [Saprospiraceae bacterium]|nr:hypothetical protein [Saprospiraceae bacterium]